MLRSVALIWSQEGERIVADIVWPDSDDAESTMAILKDKVQEHHAALFGNGKDGILDFIAGLQGQMRLILALLAVITAVSAVAMIFVTIELAHRSSLDPAKIFHFSRGTPVLSYAQRDAGS